MIQYLYSIFTLKYNTITERETDAMRTKTFRLPAISKIHL